MATNGMFERKVLAEIDLAGCPVGTVLDKNEPDQRIEYQYFKGWTNSLTAPARWRAICRRLGLPSKHHKLAGCYIPCSPEKRPGVLAHIGMRSRPE